MESPTFPEHEPIRTKRLLLRAAQESDLHSFHELFSDEDVMRYWYEPLHHPPPPRYQLLTIKTYAGPVPHTPVSTRHQNTSTK